MDYERIRMSVIPECMRYKAVSRPGTNIIRCTGTAEEWSRNPL